SLPSKTFKISKHHETQKIEKHSNMRTYQMMEHVSAFSREKGASLRAQTLSQVCTMLLAPSLQRGCQYVLGTLNCKGKDLG
ncbi:hypothetical protein BTE48_17215, partial [Oceanospirillum multiglobuliferum]